MIVEGSISSEEESEYDLLRQQESDIIDSIGNSPQGDGSAQRARQPEIKSLQRFKETMAKLHSDRLVTSAIHDLPENAGPHNSQMLAATTLSALREVSPHYLRRFVSHIGILISLKQTGDATQKVKPNKSQKTRSTRSFALSLA